MKYYLFVMVVGAVALAWMMVDTFIYWIPRAPSVSIWGNMALSVLIMLGLFAMIFHSRWVKGRWGRIFWEDPA